jgi:hypothetical protein
MSKLMISPGIIHETPEKDVWCKAQALMLSRDDGTVVKLGERITALFEYCDEATAEDHVSLFMPDDFVQQRKPIKYLFNDELKNAP